MADGQGTTLTTTISECADHAVEPAPPIPGFQRDSHGKPIIPHEPELLFAYGDLIRRTEQLILTQFSRGLVSGTTHTCLGQELCQMAVARALDHPSDALLSNHRNHGHFLTYSGEFLGLVAEIMGRRNGVCGGRGGSQHLAYRHFHSNGVQAGMSGIGVGMALAHKFRGDKSVVAITIGDGTLGEGLVYESLNLASIWSVAALFVVENNGIAQTTPTAQTIGGTIEARGAAFGIKCWRLDDADPLVFRKVEAIVAEVRESGRPGFLVLDTRRLGPHSKGDDLRDPAELEEITARDPLANLGRSLPDLTRERIETRNAAFIADIETRADGAPEAFDTAVPQHIFQSHAKPGKAAVSAAATQPPRTVRAELNAALGHLLATSQDIVLLGEDLHDPYGGAFKVTAGLSTAFPGRVISTPISEAGVAGAAIGLSLSGFRPIVEVMFADFLTLSMDQLYNHAVKFPGLFPDRQVPIVVRSPAGGRRGYGPTHSQSPENLFTSVPGLTVIYGSHRHDNGQLLQDATLAWPYPVLFLEHKLLYAQLQGLGDYEILTAADCDIAAEMFPTLVRGTGASDVTIFTYGGMLPVVEQVVHHLEQEEEISVDLVVPSLLAPFPRSTVIDHLRTRSRIAIVEESHSEFGVGAEVLASLLERGYAGKAIRVGAAPVPICSARSLENEVLPSEQTIARRILEMF
jgi:2-oxoisovalerate dehydrogenase E1 component